MIHIKQATVADADTLAAVGRSTFAQTFADQNTEADMAKYLAEKFTREQLIREFDEPNARFLLAEWEGQPAGYAKLRTVENPQELAGKRHLELERIYVLREYQGQRLGKALLEESLRLARQHQYDTLWLGVWEHNYKAIAFYQRWGFTQFGQHVFRLGDDEQIDQLMKLDLR